jgi:sugar lactone lactonase YvrE
MTTHSRLRALAAGLALSLGSLTLSAAPGFWQAATRAEFLRGQVDQLTIDEHGRLALGPSLQRVFDGSVPVIWTMTTMPDGTVFLGTGHDGKVFKVMPDGTGSLFYDSPELEVHALAPAPNGALYVGTSPDGRIYKVDANGQATPFYDPADKYIWALAADDKGVLYAATGDKGVVYRITPDGNGQRFFDTKAGHASSLRLEANGSLLVGTGSPGRVFRVDTAGKGFLVLDTPFQEVRALRIDPRGHVYAAALNAQPSNGAGAEADSTPVPPTPPSTPNVSTEIMSFAVIDVPVTAQADASATPPTSGGGAAGAVYRLQPDGLWDAVWESKDDSPYDLTIEPDGALLVATGGAGKVFRLTGDPLQAVLVARLPAKQATAMTRAGNRTLFVTANPGLLTALSNTRAVRGTYESEVKDARMVATWGSLSWRATTPAGTRVAISTRSGNTRTPDEAWSDWSAAYATAEGSAITSPNARYLQWRAELTGTPSATPLLTSVSAAYLQRNIRPKVESITVHPPGVVFQKPFSTGETEIAGFDEETQERRLANQGVAANQAGGPTLGRRIYQRGLQTLAWKAEDDNGDTLVYDILYRREGETTWRPLRSGIADTLMVWDTASVPNGTYVVKVAASDRKANPANLALTGELESVSFDIDNAPPALTIGAVQRDGARFVVPLEVHDEDSPLKSVEYSLDAQQWQPAFPTDGILDSRREVFSLRLEADAAGRTLVIRVTDALNNMSAGQVTLPAAARPQN